MAASALQQWLCKGKLVGGGFGHLERLWFSCDTRAGYDYHRRDDDRASGEDEGIDLLMQN
jgi:hypothetical protein